MDNRKLIDLRKYLKELKTQLKNMSEIIYTFFSSCKRFSKDSPKIVSAYPNIPWLLLEEWPDQDFIAEHAKHLSLG